MVLLTALLLAGPSGVLPHPLDGLLRWETGAAQAEEAFAEMGVGGTVFTNGAQVWMEVRVDGAECSITWTDRDRLFWVECVREFTDRASAVKELARGRSAMMLPPQLDVERSDGSVVQWDDPEFHFVLWLAPSEASPGTWSTGRRWASRPR